MNFSSPLTSQSRPTLDPCRHKLIEDYYCPTAEEIRAACRAIQATWSEAERRRRMGYRWSDEMKFESSLA